MTKARCVYCGNNPTIHSLSWFDRTTAIYTTKFYQRMGQLRLFQFFFRVADRLTLPFLSLLTKLRLIKWNSDISHAPNSRATVLWQEALDRGHKMFNAIVFKKNVNLYKANIGDKWIVFSDVPILESSENESRWWMDDKAELKARLQAANLPAARGGQFSSWPEIQSRFRTLEKPVIVKPRTGSRGRHTTTHIYTEDELHHAFDIAKQLCYYVVMEEHLVGSVYRGTVVDGKVVGILRGDPPRVTGDGVHTISELVEFKNANRHPEIKPVVLKDVHSDFLKRTNLDFDSVIPSGQTIDLLEKIGVSYGGNSAEDTPNTHPKIFDYLARAAQVVDYPIIGFDFIIEHISGDPDTQKWGIIEANSAPFVNLHHDPIEGIPINAAAFVWDYVERSIKK